LRHIGRYQDFMISAVSRSTITLVAAGVGIAALAGYITITGTHAARTPRNAAPAAASAPATPPSATMAAPTASPSPVVFPAPGKVFIGLQTQVGPNDLAPVTAFSAATRHRPAALQFGQG
jgi:hypothetical protein